MTNPDKDSPKAEDTGLSWLALSGSLLEHAPAGVAAVAGATGVFYVLGFVIVSISLVGTGIQNIELTRPKYVAAGIPYVIFFVVAIVLPVYAGWSLRQIDEVVYKILSVVLPFFASGMLVIFTVTLITEWSWWDNPESQTDVGILALAVMISAAILAFILPSLRLDKPTSQSSGSVPGIVLAVTIALVALIGILPVWGWVIYPNIDEVYGGPRWKEVRLVIEDDKSDLLTSIGVEVNGNLTQSLELFDISSGFLLVDLGNGNAAQIDRKLITNILYADSAPALTPTPSPCPCAPTDTPTATPTNTPTVTPTPVQCDAQQVSWAPYCFGRGTGVCINDCLDFIPWDQVKYEIEKQVLPKVVSIPDGSILRLSEDAKGRPDQIVEIIDIHGNKTGHVWFGSDPRNNWAFDGLVRVTSHFDPSKVSAIFQRCSDGSYDTLWLCCESPGAVQ